MAVNPVSQTYHWTFRRVVWATLVLVSVIFGFWLLYRFNQVIFTLFIAIVIGTVIRPAVVWLHQRGLPPTVGVIFVYLLLLLLLSGFLLLLFPLISEQGRTVAAAMPDYYQNLRGWVANNPNQFLASFNEFLPAMLPNLKPVGQTGQDVMNSAEQVARYVTAAAKVIFTAIILLVLAFYWTLEGPRVIQSFLLMLPQNQRESISDLISAMESKVGYYMVGQGILCLVIGIMALIAYLLIGLPNALVLALIAGVLEAVPMIGPLLGAVPATLVAAVHCAGKADLGDRRDSSYSAGGKQPAGAAHYEKSGGRQSLRHTAGAFCLWHVVRSGGRADGDSHCSHYSACAQSLRLSASDS
jgi:predicted PurR-regulated permease PerM